MKNQAKMISVAAVNFALLAMGSFAQVQDQEDVEIVQDISGAYYLVNPAPLYERVDTDIPGDRPVQSRAGAKKSRILPRFPEAIVISEEIYPTATQDQSERILILRDATGEYIRVKQTIENLDSVDEAIIFETAMAADHVLISLNEGKSEYDLNLLLANLGGQIHSVVRPNSMYTVRFPLLGNDSVDGSLELLRSLIARDIVEFSEPNGYVFSTGAPDDTDYGDLWGMKNTGQEGTNDDTSGEPDWNCHWDVEEGEYGYSGVDINAERAWDILYEAEDIVVAVTDSGVDYEHEDLDGNMWINSGETPGNGIDDDSNGWKDDVHGINARIIASDPDAGDPMDDHFLGHGTHVAGTIGAIGDNDQGVAGVTWNIQIMACKFLSSLGGGNFADAIQCIDYARLNGADIINASWGGEAGSAGLELAIRNARDAGIIFVAAAGNVGDDTDSTPFYPASYDFTDDPSAGDWNNVVSVAATDRRDRLGDSTVNSTASNFGETSVDIGAPGSGILSTDIGDEYRWMDGTSMAAPHVTGALALTAQRFGIDTGYEFELITRVLSSVDKITSLVDNVSTDGRLDLNRSLSVFSLQPNAATPFFQRDVDWFGYIDDEEYPEIWHGKLEEIHLSEDDLGEDSVNMYLSIMEDWTWTADDTYPYFYRSSDEAWLWFDENIQPPLFLKWFYNFETEEWESYE